MSRARYVLALYAGGLAAVVFGLVPWLVLTVEVSRWVLGVDALRAPSWGSLGIALAFLPVMVVTVPVVACVVEYVAPEDRS